MENTSRFAYLVRENIYYDDVKNDPNNPLHGLLKKLEAMSGEELLRFVEEHKGAESMLAYQCLIRWRLSSQQDVLEGEKQLDGLDRTFATEEGLNKSPIKTKVYLTLLGRKFNISYLLPVLPNPPRSG